MTVLKCKKHLFVLLFRTDSNLSFALTKDEVNHCKSVSNLPILGEGIKYVVVEQLQGVLDDTFTLDPFQSGFRPGFESKTALIAL